MGCGGCGGGKRVEEALGTALQGGGGQNVTAVETEKDQAVNGESGARGVERVAAGHLHTRLVVRRQGLEERVTCDRAGAADQRA